MKHLEDLSAGFAGADCYFTVSRPIGDEVKALAAQCTVPFTKLVKDDADGAIAIHAKSLATLLKLTKQHNTEPNPAPVVPPSPPTPPAPKQPVGGAKKTTPAAAPVVPPSPPTVETTEPVSATSDDSAAI